MSKQVEKELSKIFIKVFKFKSLNKIQNLSTKDHPDWDSIKTIELIFEIEDKFKININQTEIKNFDSFKSILNHLQSLRQ